jgi:hypothetical protein
MSRVRVLNFRSPIYRKQIKDGKHKGNQASTYPYVRIVGTATRSKGGFNLRHIHLGCDEVIFKAPSTWFRKCTPKELALIIVKYIY